MRHFLSKICSNCCGAGKLILLVLMASGCSEPAAVTVASVAYHPQVINPNYLGAMTLGALEKPHSQVVLVWGSDGSIMRSPDGRTWGYSDTPTTHSLTQIVENTHGTVLIAIGTQGTILRSIDQGLSWQLAVNPTSVDLKAALYSPAQKTWFVAGTQGTLLSSVDEGRSWSQIQLTRELSQLDIESLFMIPVSGRLLLGGTQGLFGFSDNGGASWQLSQLGLDTPLTGFYSFNDTLIATSAYGKFLLSKDNGNSWQLIETDGKAFFNDAVYDPERNTIVLVTHNGKVLSSADAGANWQMVQTTYHGTSNYLASVMFDSQQKKLRAFGHYGTHLVSTDGGRSWQAEAIPTASITFENIVPLADGKTYIGYGRGGFLASSFDNGKSWRTQLPQLDIYWREVLITPKGNWLVAGELGFILRSENQGKNWQLLDIPYTDPMTPPTYRALIIEPDTQAIIAAGPTGTIMRSTDDGVIWATVHHTPFEQAEAFTDVVVDANNKTLIAVEADGRHYVSADAGLTWKVSMIASERKFWQGALLPRAQQQSAVVIAGQRGVVARSIDGGATWDFTDVGTHADLYGSYADKTNQQFFLLGAGGVLVRSQDFGESWQIVTTGVDTDLRRMIAEPKTGALLAFGGDGVILRSTDAGNTWQPMVSQAREELRHAVIDPVTQYVFITGRDGKILRSRDGGIQWDVLPTHTATHFRSLAFDPHTQAIIAVGERIVQLNHDNR